MVLIVGVICGFVVISKYPVQPVVAIMTYEKSQLQLLANSSLVLTVYTKSFISPDWLNAVQFRAKTLREKKDQVI